MPTYTYECLKCAQTQDEFHAMSAAPKVKCNQCGSVRMRKRPGTGAGIIFKGSGFYETDYKRAGAKGGSEGGAGESKGDAKPAAKSEGASASPAKGAESSGAKKAAATG